jgi:hypothetical protein
MRWQYSPTIQIAAAFARQLQDVHVAADRPDDRLELPGKAPEDVRNDADGLLDRIVSFAFE